MDICRNLSLIGFTSFLIYISRKQRITSLVISTIGSTFILLLLIEFVFMFKLKGPSFSNFRVEGESIDIAQPEIQDASFEVTYNPGGVNKEDLELGFINKSGETISSLITVNGVKQNEIYYVFDDYGRRIDRSSHDINKDLYALFIGCSVTLGQHVYESQTLPAWYERKNPDIKSYNYGISASGPNQYLALLQDQNFKSQILQNKGLFIYPYFDFHVNRATSDFETFKWNNSTPYYYMEDGVLKRNGSFNSGRFLKSLVFSILSKSYFIEYINFNYPDRRRPEDYELTASIIGEMRNEYRKQFDSNEFYVLIMPDCSDDIIPFLEKNQIKFLDARKAVNEGWQEFLSYPVDGHPTGEFYEIIADFLSETSFSQTD